MRTRSLFPDPRCLFVLVVFLVGCGPVLERVVVTDKSAHTEGNTVPVGPPALLGAQPGKGGVIMQGTYQEARLRGLPEGNRQQGVPGSNVLRRQARGLIGVSVNHKTTLGLTGRWASASDQVVLASDLRGEENRDVWGIGFASRTTFVDNGPISFGMSFGLEALFLPYKAELAGTFVESFFDPDYCEDPDFEEPHFEGIIADGQPCQNTEEALVLERRGDLTPKTSKGVRLAWIPRVDMGLTGEWGQFRPFIWGGLVGQPVLNGIQFVEDRTTDTDSTPDPIRTSQFGNLDLDLVHYVGMGSLTFGAEFAFTEFMAIIASAYVTAPLVQIDSGVEETGLGTFGASFTLRFVIPGRERRPVRLRTLADP